MRLSFLLLSSMLTTTVLAQSITITPKPFATQPGSGSFQLDATTSLVTVGNDATLSKTAAIMAERLRVVTGLPLLIKPGKGTEQNAIMLRTAKGKEQTLDGAYQLQIAPQRITIESSTSAGIFYGLQSLTQLISATRAGTPSSLQSTIHNQQSPISLVSAKILDSPRFGWRGMHLDVSRHFFPKEFVKTYIDMLAMHKMNVFHWHLVDDHGWRIEIKKYPKLTEVGAWRVDREHLDWNVRTEQQPGEAATYGGFYTQEEIREIVQYAADRHITVVPEIEMPAHVRSVLAAYPQFSCSGKPLTVPTGTYWPCIDIYCAGNDSVFAFLEDVLEEVMALFPGTYIHVGGDEADKTAWKACPKCQERMKQEGLQNEHELQSYFIKRMERFIVSRDRRLIGWDEILEGGLAPEATVMSWRGIVGGVEAARQGHDVVMTPTDFCYFDYYQGTPAFEPRAIGGYVPLKKVYSYEPIPDSLTAEEAKHVLGAQANLWSEFIPTPAHAQYMALPRMAAIAEVAWSPKESKDWNDFSRRVEPLMSLYERFGYNYANSAYLVNISLAIDSLARTAKFVLETEIAAVDIRYTLDGTDPTAMSPVYAAPIEVTSSATLRAGSFRGTERLSAIAEQKVSFHLASFLPVRHQNRFQRYVAGGDFALTDGMRGTTSYSDGRWQGFQGVDVVATIDLGEVRELERLSTAFLQNSASWIFLPASVEFRTSIDGQQFNAVETFTNAPPGMDVTPGIKEYSSSLNTMRARYVQLYAKTMGACPDWHPGKGQPCWVFVDEFVVE